jgi:hypothetical protein
MLNFAESDYLMCQSKVIKEVKHVSQYMRHAEQNKEYITFPDTEVINVTSSSVKAPSLAV